MMSVYPEVEQWNDNGPVTDAILAEIIEASNAYALSDGEAGDPLNYIHQKMVEAIVPFIPQLLQEIAEARAKRA